MSPRPISRRSMLAGTAAAAGGALLAKLPVPPAEAQQAGAAPAAAPPVPPLAGDPTTAPGAPTTAVGSRSAFVQPKRAPVGDVSGTTLAPLQDFAGTITPSDLHFARIHAGIPAIDPAVHTLLVDGLVDRPMTFTVDDIKRFPSVTQIRFIECSGNGRAAYRAPRPDMTPQQVDGMTSNSEWTGVPLSLLLRETGVRREAKWFLAEGGDSCLLARSIPLDKAYDDALIAWAQNGEPLRPEQGFPIRLLLPGFEGNTNVKWLRRIKLGTAPFMTRWETSKYTDPLTGGKARQFSFTMDAKSIITTPAYPERVASRGWRAIRGIAWSGRGRITRVDVTTDGGATWEQAAFRSPALPKAHVRFELPWRWEGDPSFLMSRATDETGYVQPTFAELRAARGPATEYHFNCIRGWRIARDGSVTFEANT
jgi:sulfane dehydrogenase subunit SoxC